jgi:hydroxypyruvate reductase
MEFLLGLVVALQDSVPYAAIACDTDGSDGSSGVAGALARSGSWRRAQDLGLDPRRMLDDNDSRTFFAALDDLVTTGPTFNNVNDLRAVLILASDECQPRANVAD